MRCKLRRGANASLPELNVAPAGPRELPMMMPTRCGSIFVRVRQASAQACLAATNASFAERSACLAIFELTISAGGLRRAIDRALAPAGNGSLLHAHDLINCVIPQFF